jgi:hypothetical protein
MLLLATTTMATRTTMTAIGTVGSRTPTMMDTVAKLPRLGGLGRLDLILTLTARAKDIEGIGRTHFF